MKVLVATELQKAEDADCRDRLASVLVEPNFLPLAWGMAC
jgi:hypothetical protein